MIRCLAIFIVVVCLRASAQPPTAPEIRSIAERAYIFAYPMVLMHFTSRGFEINNLTNAPAFPNASFRRVIRPNADTLYTTSWMDVSREPVLLHVPDTGGRYYMLQFMDLWTETFAAPGKRTTGTGEEWLAIVGPGWKGTLPGRAKRIDAPTNTVWMIGRVQTNGAADFANVHAIQRGFQLMPLGLYPDGPRNGRLGQAMQMRGTPPEEVGRLSGVDFFRTFADLLRMNPPHAGDEPMMAQLARIGIVPGKRFEPEALGVEGLKAIEEGARGAAARLGSLDRREMAKGKTGWSGFAGKSPAVGRYGTNYEARAVVARIGLGANPPEDAVYMNCGVDGEGKPLNGASAYRIHFSKEQLPKVKAFWSVTMYGDDGYFAANAINRFAIGDRDSLQYNNDGSLDLWVQRESPGKDKESNWLPAAPGAFNLSLRLYWPGGEILTGKWLPPRVELR